MPRLHWTNEASPSFPSFPIPRLLVGDVLFEPAPGRNLHQTWFNSAIVDTGSPYVVIPHVADAQRFIRIHEDLGQRPYRLITDPATGSPSNVSLQRFAVVGIRFGIVQSTGEYALYPSEFVKVQAYLLDVNTRPKKRILIGLHALRESFVCHIAKDDAHLEFRPFIESEL